MSDTEERTQELTARQLRVKAMRLELDGLFKRVESGECVYEESQHRINQLIDQIEEYDQPQRSTSHIQSGLIGAMLRHIMTETIADSGENNIGISFSTGPLNTQEDVPVPLSKDELERIPKGRVSSEESNKHRCVICMDDCTEGQMIMNLPCSHNFHEACVTKHFQNKPTCPLCKSDIRDMLDES